MKDSEKTRKQRVLDLRSFLGRNSHLFTLKDVCKRAKVNYESASNAMGLVVRKNRSDAISDQRLSDLEQAAIDMADEHKKATATA